MSRQESVCTENNDSISEAKSEIETSASSISSEEPPSQLQLKKNSNQKRPAPKPPVLSESVSSSESDSTSVQKPLSKEDNKSADRETISLQHNTGEVIEQLSVNTTEDPEPKEESSTDKVMLISASSRAEPSPLGSPLPSDERGKVKENGNFASNDNCQVTISSNHSTIINPNENIAEEEDKSNISIVTIENGTNISIKSSEVKSNDLGKVASFSSNDGSHGSPVAVGKRESVEKIVLNNEYVPQKERNFEHSVKETFSGEQDKLSRTSSNNDASVKTTIKVNLNLVSEKEKESVPKLVKQHTENKQESTNSKLLTRIDQVNSRNYERKRIPPEVIISNQPNAVSNDVENTTNHANSTTNEQAVILRKKREMVCLLDSFDLLSF